MTAIETENIVGCILAGGLSKRMGRDKAGAVLGRGTLIEHAVHRLRPQVGHLILNADTASPAHRALGLPVVGDPIPGNVGPLAGILAAMQHAQASFGATHVATVAVDTPFFPGDLVSRLAGSLADPSEIALASSAGRLHPVFGLWPVSASAKLERWMRATTNFSVRAFVDGQAGRTVEFPFSDGLDPFFNINTPEDLAEAVRLKRLDP